MVLISILIISFHLINASKIASSTTSNPGSHVISVLESFFKLPKFKLAKTIIALDSSEIYAKTVASVFQGIFCH